MSPWPGSPKSASSPPINPPSQRYPDTLNENSTTGEVAQAIRVAYNGLTVHEQAFRELPAQIQTTATAAATTAIEEFESTVASGVSSFNTLTGAILYFPGLGDVTNELGNTSYTAQQGDGGAKIIAGDSSPVTIVLSPSLMAPWFCIIDNDSSAAVNLSGPIKGDSSISANGSAVVSWDGNFFWVGVSNPSSGFTGTVTTAKLTTGGTNGSLTFSSGLLTAQTPAT